MHKRVEDASSILVPSVHILQGALTPWCNFWDQPPDAHFNLCFLAQIMVQ